MTTAQIFVLGMHRSGTSAITNLLANMGAFFGDSSDSIGASAENPKGFWERRDVRSVNDLMLHSLGCEWDILSHWDIDKIPNDVLAEAKSRIRDIFKKLLITEKSFVIKDPRLCLLAPIWMSEAANPIVIYVHRKPHEIAQSLRSRDGLPIDFGLKLWECYSSNAIRAIAKTKTIFVDYQDVLNNELHEARRIRDFLVTSGASDFSGDNEDNFKGTVEPNLKNQTSIADNSSLSNNQSTINQFISSRCSNSNGPQLTIDDITPVIASSSDRDECIRAIKKYSNTKMKYDELQVYKNTLKEIKSQLENERSLLQHLDPLAIWVANSTLMKIFFTILAPLSNIKPVSKLSDYYFLLVKHFRKDRE